MRTTSLFSLAILGAALMLTASGCASKSADPNRVTVESLRADLTPEMESVGLNHDQRVNRHIRTFNTNIRQVWDDLDAILMLDRPNRMSPYPIP